MPARPRMASFSKRSRKKPKTRNAAINSTRKPRNATPRCSHPAGLYPGPRCASISKSNSSEKPLGDPRHANRRDMPRIELAEEIAEDFERILDHLFTHESADPAARITEILRAVDVLEFNPEIGLPNDGGVRELILCRHAYGFVPLYRYVPKVDVAFVLAIR